MDAAAVIHATWQASQSGRENRDMLQAMREILQDQNFIVCKDDAELREKALDQTDLVEPTEASS